MIHNRSLTGSHTASGTVTAAQLHLQCQAFASKLFRLRITTDDMLVVQAMREAFEVENPEENIRSTLIAVDCWLKRNQVELVERIVGRHGKTTTETGDSYRHPIGLVYHAEGGRPRLDKVRWNFWKARFLTMTKGRHPCDLMLRLAAVGMHYFEGVKR